MIESHSLRFYVLIVINSKLDDYFQTFVYDDIDFARYAFDSVSKFDFCSLYEFDSIDIPYFQVIGEKYSYFK